MRRNLFWLSDEQWLMIEPYFPKDGHEIDLVTGDPFRQRVDVENDAAVFIDLCVLSIHRRQKVRLQNPPYFGLVQHLDTMYSGNWGNADN